MPGNIFYDCPNADQTRQEGTKRSIVQNYFCQKVKPIYVATNFMHHAPTDDNINSYSLNGYSFVVSLGVFQAELGIWSRLL